MYKLITITLCVLLSSCATPKPIYIATKCPTLSLPSKPVYPIKQLRPGDPAPKVMKAYVASLQMCIMDNEDMRKRCGGNNE